MITSKDILSYNFYTYKQPFTGSDHGMRYRIVRVEEKPEEGSEEKPKKFFHVSVWKEPYAYDCTPAEEIENQDFPFDEEGYEQVLVWLNEKAKEFHE